jgi:hypothetical protein
MAQILAFVLVLLLGGCGLAENPFGPTTVVQCNEEDKNTTISNTCTKETK